MQCKNVGVIISIGWAFQLLLSTIHTVFYGVMKLSRALHELSLIVDISEVSKIVRQFMLC